MEKNINDDYNKEKIDRNLLLFDNGFTELSYNGKNETINKNEIEGLKRKNINWYTFYLILFKNTLISKSLVPKEELKLRLNVIRQYLPPYYNCQKNIENSNTNSIMKKFTYHIYSRNNLLKKLIEKKNERKFSFYEDENESEEENSMQSIQENKFERRKSKTRTEKFTFSKLNLLFFNDKKLVSQKTSNIKKQKLKVIEEYQIKNSSQEKKRTPIKLSTTKYNEKFSINKKLFMSPNNDSKSPSKKSSNLNVKFLEMEKNVKVKFNNKFNGLGNEFENNNKEIIIRTPNDNEYPLVLTEKRMINNNNQTYFMDFLNKLNDETKNEKINTYKKEVTSQILKFNEMYFDTKMEDFSQDNLFNELKSTCDMFINKFNFDNQEEKNLGDLDKFL